MANPYRSGTADVWYSGERRDLWIEYKWLEIPKRDDTEISFVAKKDPLISVLQQDWIARRIMEGRTVWVIVGSKNGGVIYDNNKWAHPTTAERFKKELRSRNELAQAILDWCT